MYPIPAVCTWTLIAITIAVSLYAFYNREVEERLIFDPYRILAGKQYHRLITSAFLHADWAHLGLNMMSLYFFAPMLELWFGPTQLLLIYFGSILGGDLLSLFLHRHHEYRSYGASGGVCGIIFAYILLLPGSGVSMYFLPISIPGWLYALLYLYGSFHALRAGRNNVGHDAHIGGAIIGLVIAAALHPQRALNNPLVFGIVLVFATALFFYLRRNPTVSGPAWPTLRKRRSSLPVYKQEQSKIDAILEKVSEHGIHSLDEHERALLDQVSGKYRRRAESERPKSGLSI